MREETGDRERGFECVVSGSINELLAADDANFRFMISGFQKREL
jgi:hypothetical protein